MFVFTACNSGADAGTEEAVVEEVVACAKDCQKACCLGCQAEGGTCLAERVKGNQ